MYAKEQPKFHVNIKLSSNFPTGEVFWKYSLYYSLFGTTLIGILRIKLAIQLHAVDAFDVDGDTFIVQTESIQQIRIKVKDPQDWLLAWQRGLTELHGNPPHEVSPGRWQVVKRPGIVK
jgi:hypothetical protein